MNNASLSPYTPGDISESLLHFHIYITVASYELLTIISFILTILQGNIVILPFNINPSFILIQQQHVIHNILFKQSPLPFKLFWLLSFPFIFHYDLSVQQTKHVLLIFVKDLNSIMDNKNKYNQIHRVLFHYGTCFCSKIIFPMQYKFLIN